MLFNTFGFLFGFLPVTFAGFFLLARFGRLYAAVWLGAASLFFYAVWDVRYLALLLGSIGFNFAVGLALNRGGADGARRALLTAGVAGDLLLLGYFKYSGFFVANLDAVAGAGFSVPRIALPLGISFFTFTQIAYLVDAYRREVRENRFVNYLLFVTFFPHLIAGPIIHHKEMMPQFASAEPYRFDAAKFVAGIGMFTMGLFKKAILADGIAAYVPPLFGGVEHGLQPPLADAWGGALAYTFQLYFDFSGYCDMAIGLAWMIGIALPLNFNSPYKALSITDFWRRWHMTLSRFLRDYLYIPLGGNRRGQARRYFNLLLTMTIGGLWHGAGWTFVLWGALHGAYLAVNHAWSAVRARAGVPAAGRAGVFGGWLLTFVAVVVGWVFFRAQSLPGALAVLAGMAGRNGLTGGGDPWAWAWCAALGLIAFAMPNTQEIMRRHLGGIARPREPDVSASLLPLLFARGAPWAAAFAVLLAVSLIDLPQPTSFLYFNF